MSSNKSRPGGGKHPNSPRYSDRYGAGHVNPYLGGQPGQSAFIRDMEQRQEAARKAAEEEQARLAAEREAARRAAQVENAAREARRREEAAQAAQQRTHVSAEPVRSGEHRRGREETQSRSLRDPGMRERLRQIQEKALKEARDFVRGDAADFDDLDFGKQPADVRLKLSEDNQPMIALESVDSRGKKQIRWVPVVLSEKEMESFFPAIEPVQESRESKLREEISNPAAEAADDSSSQEELVLIPIAGAEETEAPAVTPAKGVKDGSAASELIDGRPEKKNKQQENKPEKKASEKTPADDGGDIPAVIVPTAAPGKGEGLKALLETLPSIAVEPEEEAAEPAVVIGLAGVDSEEDAPSEPPAEEEPEETEEEPAAEETSEETQPEDGEKEESPAQPAVPVIEHDVPDEEEDEADEDQSESTEEEPAEESEEEEETPAPAEEPEEPENSEEAEESAAEDGEESEEVNETDVSEESEEEPADAEKTEEPEDAGDDQPEEAEEESEGDSPAEEETAEEDEEPEDEEPDKDEPDEQNEEPEEDESEQPVIPGTLVPDDLAELSEEDMLFRRKARPEATALFVMPNGAKLPKYIDDDDFVERWLGDKEDEDEDMASQKRRRRRRISAIVGAVGLVLALVGFIAVAKWGIGLLGGLTGSESQKEIYGEFIAPAVMSEVPEFETWEAIPQDKLLQSAVFSILMDMDVTYERDDTGKFIIPSTDVVNAVKKLYGAYSADPAEDEEINTRIRNALYGSAGEDTTNEDAYYVDSEDSFHVADGLSGPAPQVTDISRRDNTVTLNVEYMEDLEIGSGGVLYSRQFILTLAEGGYYVQAIRAAEE